jgi:hypothetical protein
VYDSARACVCVYVQKVADFKPGIELGFMGGRGGEETSRREGREDGGLAVLGDGMEWCSPFGQWRGAFMGWGSARGTKEEGPDCTQQTTSWCL